MDRKRTWLILIVIGLIVAAGVFGWQKGRSSTSNQTQTVTSSPTSPTENTASNIKSIASYTLPSQSKELSCPNDTSIYVIPSNNDADCGNPDSLPIKISVDPANNTDCNQLQNVQNVSKHICVSEFINGKKALKAETVYNQSSAYGKATTVNAYYINTGKGVVKVEYVHDPNDNRYQMLFEDVAKSVQAK